MMDGGNRRLERGKPVQPGSQCLMLCWGKRHIVTAVTSAMWKPDHGGWLVRISGPTLPQLPLGHAYWCVQARQLMVLSDPKADLLDDAPWNAPWSMVEEAYFQAAQATKDQP